MSVASWISRFVQAQCGAPISSRRQLGYPQIAAHERKQCKQMRTEKEEIVVPQMKEEVPEACRKWRKNELGKMNEVPKGRVALSASNVLPLIGPRPPNRSNQDNGSSHYLSRMKVKRIPDYIASRRHLLRIVHLRGCEAARLKA